MVWSQAQHEVYCTHTHTFFEIKKNWKHLVVRLEAPKTLGEWPKAACGGSVLGSVSPQHVVLGLPAWVQGADDFGQRYHL